MRIAAVTGALLAGVLSAQAADLSIPRAPQYLSANPFNWSGFTIGVEAGWGISSMNLNTVGITTGIDTSAGALGPDASGGVGGFNIGFRQQPAGSQIAWGIKGAVDLTGINSAGSNGNIFNFNAAAPAGSVSLPWDARLMAEISFAASSQLLLFLEGGGAIGDVKHNVDALVVNPNATFFETHFDNRNIHFGWVIGAGFDYALAPNVLVGFEWIYTNLGHQGLTVNTTTIPTVPTAFVFDDNVAYNKFLATLKYKFGT